jgi:hypothetical protein
MPIRDSLNVQDVTTTFGLDNAVWPNPDTATAPQLSLPTRHTIVRITVPPPGGSTNLYFPLRLPSDGDSAVGDVVTLFFASGYDAAFVGSVMLVDASGAGSLASISSAHRAQSVLKVDVNTWVTVA